jgi:hypothetical protein
MSTYSGDMIDIWLLDHSAHSMLNRAISKLVVGMLFPDILKIKIGTSDLGFQELKISRVRDRLHVIVKMLVEWRCESVALSFGVVILDSF